MNLKQMRKEKERPYCLTLSMYLQTEVDYIRRNRINIQIRF